MKQYNIVFMGTPQFAVPSLEALINNNYNVVAVISQPDKKVGRGQKIIETPTSLVAKKHKIPVFQPNSKEELNSVIKGLRPDLVIVVAYGRIISDEALSIPNHGYINVHGSLLPKYRGASCVAQAILDGEKETGVTIMEISNEMDTGNIIAQEKVAIKNDDTTETLMRSLSLVGAELLTKTLPFWLEGKITSKPQETAKATYCTLIKKEDGIIDWAKPAVEIERMIRAYDPWPLTTFTHNGKNYKILKATTTSLSLKAGEFSISSNTLLVGTGKGSLQIDIIQPEGKKPMKTSDFLNGYRKYF